MEYLIKEVAERIYSMRDILEISPEEMAKITNTTVEEYLEYEQGNKDFSFTFLYCCAEKFEIDIMELLTGERPRLSFYSITRKGKGMPITRRAGFKYNHIAPMFRNKTAEPFIVTAPYNKDAQDKPIALSYHEGQELDYILKGKLKVRMEDHYEVLEEGDAIYYNSAHGHGMIATGGEECIFMAVVMKPQSEEKTDE